MSVKGIINFSNLAARGVSAEMINLAGLHVYEEYTIQEEDVVHPWTYALDTHKLFNGYVLRVMGNGKQVFCFSCRVDYTPSSADIHARLAEWLISSAHQFKPALAGAVLTVMDAYRTLGCDRRMNEAHALISGPAGVMVYREPMWRKSNEDTGSVKTLPYLLADLGQYLPKHVLPSVELTISNYLTLWECVYGEKPELTSFVRRREAGIRYYVVIGTGKGAVDIQFNYCDVFDKDTLQPNPHILSVFQDFKSVS